jgi:hypothetical protein
VVTGVTAGTSVITYTDNNGCSQTATVTVNAGVPCPEILNLVSTADDYAAGTQLRQASATNGKITATNKITGTANTTYQAKSIELGPGFSAEAGTVFKAQVGGCN